MKKWIVLLMAIVMVVSLTACPGGGEVMVPPVGGDADVDTTQEQPGTQTQPEVPEVPEEEEVPEFVAEDYDEVGTCGDDLQWGYVDATGELVIMGSGEMDDYAIEYTDDYDTYSTAPWGDLEIRSVRLVGVTKVGAAAFSCCEELIDVEWGNDLVEIGDEAFDDCVELEEVVLPDTLEKIGLQAFSSCAFTEITIPAGVTEMGEEVFEFCTDLTYIDVDAANTSYTSEDGVLFDADMTTLICYPVSKEDSSYVIPEGVKALDKSAFLTTDYLEEVTLPESLETIGDWCFAFNENLTEVTIPDNVESLGSFAFSDCTSLEVLNLGSGIETIGYSAFDGCTSLIEVYFNGGQAEWDAITIEEGNDCLHAADIYGNA